MQRKWSHSFVGAASPHCRAPQRERWKEGSLKEEGFHRLEDVAQGRAERALPGTTWACVGKEDRRGRGEWAASMAGTSGPVTCCLYSLRQVI